MARNRSGRTPPFCPNPDCDSRADPATWRFRKKGFFSRKRHPHKVQRYQCQHCGRCFSSQTFIVPPGASATILSDEHQSYPRALRQLPNRTIQHETTSSKASRTTQNPLFPVNLADLLLRHSSANHKRETIAFSKRRQGALYRMAIFAVWRNYVKSTSENRSDEPPGVTIGVIKRRLSVRKVLETRLVPRKRELSPWLERCYWGRIPTRRLPRIRVHQARFAF